MAAYEPISVELSAWSPDGVLAVDPGGRVRLANAPAEALLGLSPGGLAGRPVEEIVPAHREAERRLLRDACRAVAATGEPALVQVHAAGGAGELPLEVGLGPLAGPGGRFVACVVRDASDRRRVEDELRDSRRRLEEAQELARIGSWEWDIPANRVSWSDELYRIYGYEPGAFEPTYERFLERVHPEDRESVDARNRKAFADHEPFEDVKRIVRPDGSVFLMRTQGEVILDERGEPLRMVGVCEDVTDEVRAAEAQERLASLVESSFDAIVSYTPDGVVTSWNPGARRLFGWTDEEAIGRPVSMLVPEPQIDEHRRNHAHVLSGMQVDHFETRRVRRDGRIVDVSITMSPIRDANGRIAGVSAISRDVTERKRFEAQLRHLAHHDGLTGLFNRRRFEDELEAAVARAGRYGLTGAVLLLDLDNFKYVNDTFGHATGDRLIRGIATALRARLRESDVLARLGGDELAALLPSTSAAQAATVADDLLEVVRHHVIVEDGHRISTTTSIGVRLFDDRAAATADVLADADRAMYEAKDGGRDRVVLHTPARARQARTRTRQSWEHRIHEALEHDRFVLHCQPILDLHTDCVSQYELLLRMHGEAGLTPPGAFLGVAERLGLVQAIDRWVVRQAIELLATAKGAGSELRLEVNLSGQSVGDRELLALIEAELNSAGVDPSQLVFEITETAAIANMEEARRFADTLVGLGCRFALDDFGAGFGSFYYLKHLPADYLKIDGDFVRAPHSRADELVIEAIVSVARGLGKRTIAEFVEDAETEMLVREHGVDFSQGFHTGRPFPVAELALAISAGGAHLLGPPRLHAIDGGAA